MIHPVVPPPQFFNTSSVTEVVNLFQGNGLEIANIKLVTNDKLHSWTFVKDNILLVLDGKLPEGRAREFEKVLYDLKK